MARVVEGSSDTGTWARPATPQVCLEEIGQMRGFASNVLFFSLSLVVISSDLCFGLKKSDTQVLYLEPFVDAQGWRRVGLQGLE